MESTLRKIICIFSLLVFCVFSSAFAKDFERFGMEIPAGWYTERDGDGFRFLHPENNCIINVLVGNLQEAPSREIAIALYQGLNGKNAKEIDGGFTFDMKNEDNIPGRVRFTYYAETFSAVSAIGQCYPFQQYLSSLVIYKNDGQNKKQIIAEISRPFPVLPPPSGDKNLLKSIKE